MQEDQHSLKVGTVIDKYKIIRILGEGGFGITYLAEDIHLGLKVVIKEYFPNEFAMRSGNSNITAKSKSLGDFSKGMHRFKEEAQTLAKFNHPSIVKILGYFEANDTAYFVMEYEEGMDLSQYLKEQNRALSQEEILSIMMPVLEGLKEVHAHNYLHRDIKPGNILLRNNRSPVLIDFGASKLAIGEASRSITSVLTEGYAPLEQYSTDIKQQGPFTDIYAIAAVMYKMITGDVPPSAQTRSYQFLQDDNDPYKPLVELQLKGYDESFLKAIDRALSMKAKDRPRNVQEFQKDIAGKLKIEEQNTPEKPEVKNNSRVIGFLVLLLLFIGGSYYYLTTNSHENEIKNPNQGTLTQEDINDSVQPNIVKVEKKVKYIDDDKAKKEVEHLKKEREEIEQLRKEKAQAQQEELEKSRKEKREREEAKQIAKDIMKKIKEEKKDNHKLIEESVSRQMFYIQIGTFTQKPSSRFLKVIKENGFNYKLVTYGTRKKLLLGPYMNRESAEIDLVRAQDRINKSSFIVKIKS